MKQQIQKFLKTIEWSQKILLINHIRMDGDAWWSLCALALILKKLWKHVEAINDCNVPPSFWFLWHTDIINPDIDIKQFAPDCIIALDTSCISRLGESYKKWQIIFTDTPLIVIDHHISNPSFWDINIIDSKSSSTCELLTNIIQTLWFEYLIDEEIATFLYLGIQTDTIMYYNSNTTSKTLKIWSWLVWKWANYHTIIYEMFQKKSFKQLKLWGILIENMQQDISKNINYSSISPYEIGRLNIKHEEIWWYLKWAISELMINIEETKISFLIYPISLEENKVSMRSQTWYDVASICESFWWGWHTQAAWFQTKESTEVVTEKLLRKISEIL